MVGLYLNQIKFKFGLMIIYSSSIRINIGIMLFKMGKSYKFKLESFKLGYFVDGLIFQQPN